MGLFRRQKPDAAVPRQADPPSDVIDLAEYAPTAGWQRLGDQPFHSVSADFIGWTSLDIVGEVAHSGEWQGGVAHVTTYRDAYGGDLDGRPFRVANAFTSGWKGSWVSVAELWFPTMPQVQVVPKRRLRKLEHGNETGDPEFDQRFAVFAHDTALAEQLLVPPVRAQIQRRDDWYFQMCGFLLTCVCPARYESVEEIQERLSVLESILLALPPEFVKDPTPTELPTLPDGTPIDVTRPDELKAAVMALTPEQQAEMLQEMQQLDPAQAIYLLKQFKQSKNKGGSS